MEMNSPGKRRHARTRQAIIDAARQIIVKQGIEALSMRTLADKVDYSPSALYKYFDSKRDILLVIRNEGFERLGNYILSRVQADTPTAEQFYKMGKAYLEFAENNPQIYQLMFDTTETGPGSITDVTGEQGFGGMLQFLEAGVVSGMLTLPQGHTPVSLAFQLWITMHGVAMLKLSIMRDAGPWFDEISDQILRAFVGSFSAD